MPWQENNILACRPSPTIAVVVAWFSGTPSVALTATDENHLINKGSQTEMVCNSSCLPAMHGNKLANYSQLTFSDTVLCDPSFMGFWCNVHFQWNVVPGKTIGMELFSGLYDSYADPTIFATSVGTCDPGSIHTHDPLSSITDNLASWIALIIPSRLSSIIKCSRPSNSAYRNHKINRK